MRRLPFWLLVLFFCTNSWAYTEKDSILTCKKVDFLQDLVRRQGSIYPIFCAQNSFLHPRDPLHAAKPQILIKGKQSLLISFSGSSRVYQLKGENDSSFVFERIDRSPNMNYNIGAYYFFDNGKLHAYGGYGFWKNNGTLKVFNQNDRQWDIITMEKEIFPQLFPVGNTWLDEKKRQLHVPFQSRINEGVEGGENVSGVVNPRSYVLDLNKHVWKETGEVNKEVLALLRSPGFLINTPQGQLVTGQNDFYLLDYRNNLLKKDPTQIRNQALLKQSYDHCSYYYQGYVYHYDPEKNQYDSIQVDLSRFISTSIPITEKNPSALLLMAALFSPLLFVIYIFRESKDAVTTSTIVKKNAPVFQVSFTNAEKALLRLLYEKTMNGQKATVPEVNYVLGVRDKKTGMQKKVRSDIFNSIEEKYRFMDDTNEPLIMTFRSESDKRFLEFSLSPASLSIIKIQFT